jgi:hypothetical protein
MSVTEWAKSAQVFVHREVFEEVRPSGMNASQRGYERIR